MPIFTLHIGNITLSPTWYGLMYMLSFLIAYIFMRRYVSWKRHEDLDTLLFWSFLGVVIGGRMGYVCFYNPQFFFSHPLEILKIWE